MEPKPRIVLITSRWFKNQNLYFTALKLVQILKPLSRDITWIITEQEDKNYPAGEFTLLKIPDRTVERPLLVRLWYLVLHQMRVVRQVLCLGKDQDIVIFAFGADYFVLPMLAAKLKGKQVALRTDGRTSRVIGKYWQKKNRPLQMLYQGVEAVTYGISDAIIPESEAFIGLYDLGHYEKKTWPGSLYVDTARFAVQKGISEREYDLGFVGRFSREKGIVEFVSALGTALHGEECRVALIGDGDLRGEVEAILARDHIQASVDVIGWIDNADLPQYLNTIKVLVVPSYREGLPNIVLEAMACGCIVLATPVGGIPALVRDGVTGFISEDNAPATLSRNIRRALRHPGREGVGKKARELIERSYTYDAAVRQYGQILAHISS
ncbi:glycosyltransferase family 4 protein [Methanofollis ethanolicus]|uniref:glycosyltransferase family 4 protein n=1 Tax=Methanofollis ethanolicus TaxID=488124 RepID=UPI000835E2D7|nr:glycosyltransferase family 4 protein [Methanofollis ethanolicus]